MSHQTVLNYADTIAKLVKPFVDDYPDDLPDSFCGDETYIRVSGKWHYLSFFFDAVKTMILADETWYTFCDQGYGSSATKTPRDLEGLCFIVDGNPIYILAQHFFAQHGIPFDIHQVIGLTNDDQISTEYRPLKQIIERLNRTIKGYFSFTNGFGSNDGALSWVTLFVAYFNFLRPHTKLEQRVQVMLPELRHMPHMPARWSKLIELAQDYILDQHVS